jgi:hypothetical protein
MNVALLHCYQPYGTCYSTPHRHTRSGGTYFTPEITVLLHLRAEPCSDGVYCAFTCSGTFPGTYANVVDHPEPGRQ